MKSVGLRDTSCAEVLVGEVNLQGQDLFALMMEGWCPLSLTFNSDVLLANEQRHEFGGAFEASVCRHPAD